MKIRTGFVSNSSSSSFLVAFPRNPKSAEDLQEMIFGKETWFAHPYGDDDYYPDGYPTAEIAEVLWDEIKGQIPNNINFIISEMYNVVSDNYTDYYDDNNRFDYERHKEANKFEVEKFLSENEGAFFYHFEFHDDSGEPKGCGLALEHGGTFKRLPYIVSSNH